MPYFAAHPELYVGKKVGNGDSVAFVQAISLVPGTAVWRAGIQVTKASSTVIMKGTVIATFKDGYFPHEGHASVYLDHDPSGILVLDQWSGQLVHYRTIPYFGAAGDHNQADFFSVVE